MRDTKITKQMIEALKALDAQGLIFNPRRRLEAARKEAIDGFAFDILCKEKQL